MLKLVVNRLEKNANKLIYFNLNLFLWTFILHIGKIIFFVIINIQFHSIKI